MKKKILGSFIKMSRFVNEINRETIRIMGKYDLTLGQFAVLEALYHKGVLCVGEIQDLILTTTGNIPVIMKNLTKNHLVEIVIKDGDKRKKHYDLTDKGRNIIAKAYPENEKIILDSFSKWNEKEIEELFRLLRK